jgi:hypothetical protein
VSSGTAPQAHATSSSVAGGRFRSEHGFISHSPPPPPLRISPLLSSTPHWQSIPLIITHSESETERSGVSELQLTSIAS